MSKRKLYPIIIFIVLFIVAGYYLFQFWQNNYIKNISNNYLINLVGVEEFEANYKLKLSSIFGCSNNEYGCWVEYEFLPGKEYGGNIYSFYYSAKENKIKEMRRFSEVQLPSCLKDQSNCDFKLTNKELGDIISEEDEKNARAKLIRLIMDNNMILVRVNYCDMLGDNNQKKILVDPRGKKVVWRGESTECGIK
jgi:hypothetical protein